MSPTHDINKVMTELNENKEKKNLNWGAALFFSVLFLVLVFFWWLLIYSGGVAGHHG